MLVVKDLNQIPPMPQPCGLTIGNFDGVHVGHVALLSYLKKRVKSVGVVTFANHPSEYFGKPLPLISSLEERLFLLEKAGVDLVILLQFDDQLTSKTYEQFLREIHEKYPFSLLVLGKGSVFGYKRQGTEENVKKLPFFTAEYLEKTLVDGEIVSSGKIRTYLQEKAWEKAAKLLGH